MQFFSTVLAGAAFVAAALAVEINQFPSSVVPGSQYQITYQPGGTAPTTLILRKGANENLANVSTLTTTATGGTYQWTVDKSLPSGNDYALMIIQGGAANYIGPIALTGGAQASSSASVSASSAASASSASSVSARSSSASAASVSASLSSSASLASVSAASRNATISSATLSSAAASSAAATTGAATNSAKASGTTTGGTPQNTGAASTLGSSPLALLFGAAAAMAYLN